MINKVHYYPKVVKMDRHFREAIGDVGQLHESHRKYYPMIGYCTPWDSSVRLKGVYPWTLREMVRKGTFGVYRGELKGCTHIVKLKNCVYIPEIRNKQEFDMIIELEARTIDDFMQLTVEPNLHVKDVL